MRHNLTERGSGMARQDTIGTTATTVAIDADGVTRVIYHSTCVVAIYPPNKDGDRLVALDSGGWRTATTKLRMNQASNQFGLGFRVFQKAGEWFVEDGSRLWDFIDKLTIFV